MYLHHLVLMICEKPLSPNIPTLTTRGIAIYVVIVEAGGGGNPSKFLSDSILPIILFYIFHIAMRVRVT